MVNYGGLLAVGRCMSHSFSCMFMRAKQIYLFFFSEKLLKILSVI